MEKEQLIRLISQYVANSMSDKDLALLQDVLRKKTDEDLLEIWDLVSYENKDNEVDRLDADSLFQKIVADIDRKTYPVQKANSRTLKRIVAVLSAACLIVMLKFAFDFYRDLVSDDTEMAITTEDHQILPGGNKARILLADGAEIDLEMLTNDTTVTLDGYSVHKTADGSITYVVHESDIKQSNIYNTIVTPRGGEYNLIMADGTRIAINSSSTLRYPISFNEEVRNVELEGEAYFEVEPLYVNNRKIPFIVKTSEQTLEVLGTTFNINSYGETIQTTLVEGAVKLSFEEGKPRLLKPNQQAVFEKVSKRTEINTVDPFYITAWKNGSFAFEDASIQEVMESLGRWYDLEVVFKSDLRNNKFSGTISKFEDIDKLLKAIELTGSVKFEIQGRRIFVMK